MSIFSHISRLWNIKEISVILLKDTTTTYAYYFDVLEHILVILHSSKNYRSHRWKGPKIQFYVLLNIFLHCYDIEHNNWIMYKHKKYYFQTPAAKKIFKPHRTSFVLTIIKNTSDFSVCFQEFHYISIRKKKKTIIFILYRKEIFHFLSQKMN